MCVVMGVMSGAAWAQTEPGAKPGADPVAPPAEKEGGGAEDGVLRGPSVRTRSVAAATLIRRGFDGKVERLEVDPAQAALELLALTEEEKAATEKILTERAALLDRIVLDHLREVVELAQAAQSGDQAGTEELYAELARAGEPLRARGRLVEELAGVLDETKEAKLRGLVKEYWGAIVTERVSERGEDGKKRTMGEAVREEVTVAIGREIRGAYERVVGARVKEFDALIAKLELKPEVEAEIRRVVMDSFTSTFGKATEKEKAAVFREIYARLDARQRGLLLDEVMGAGR